MSATIDHGAGESEVSHWASMAANFIGWSSRATWASVCPLTMENTVPMAAKTSPIRSDREKTSVSCRRSRWKALIPSTKKAAITHALPCTWAKYSQAL